VVSAHAVHFGTGFLLQKGLANGSGVQIARSLTGRNQNSSHNPPIIIFYYKY
jgi:hypothetical protein